jgi:hypothetical protein
MNTFEAMKLAKREARNNYLLWWNFFRQIVRRTEPPTEDAEKGDVGSTGAETTSSGLEKDNNDQKKRENRLFKSIIPKEPFTTRNQIRRTFFNSWINILLIFAPVGVALNYVSSVNRVAVFVVNFIAIIPLAAMLSFATEEIALRTGETLGGLLNATFGYVTYFHVHFMYKTE